MVAFSGCGPFPAGLWRTKRNPSYLFQMQWLFRALESRDSYTSKHIRTTGHFFVNEHVGYVVGNAGSIMKTTDGSINWKILHDYNSSPRITNAILTTVYFVNEETGFVGGWKVGSFSAEDKFFFPRQMEDLVGPLLIIRSSGNITIFFFSIHNMD